MIATAMVEILRPRSLFTTGNAEELSGCSQVWKMFRTMKNKVTTMLRNSKQAFFNRNVNTTNKKQFWKTVKYMRLDKSTILTVSLDENQAITKTNRPC